MLSYIGLQSIDIHNNKLVPYTVVFDYIDSCGTHHIYILYKSENNFERQILRSLSDELNLQPGEISFRLKTDI